MAEHFGEGDEVTLWGEVFKTEDKTSRDGNTFIFTAYFSDKTSSEILKIITAIENADVIKSNIKPGKAIIVTGKFEFDTFAKCLNIRPYSIASVKTRKRKDKAEDKRVELHLHTTMSDMDAITPAGELVKQAFAWGHKAIAITDHGNVQAFPEAMNTVEKIRKDGGEFKIIYGMEAYFVNDSDALVSGCNECPINGDVIVFDIETTGLSRDLDRITEIGAVKLNNMEVVDRFQTFVNPERPIPANITELTGITDEMVEDAPSEKEALEKFIAFAGKGVLVAHNADFDTSFIKIACARQGLTYDIRYADTLKLARAALPHLKNFKLDTVAKEFKLGDFNHHRAIDDAEMLSKIFISLVNISCKGHPLEKFGDFNSILGNVDVKKLNTYHMGKYLLRHAFEKDHLLPDDILWRQKAAFSDAVGHSMVDDLKAYAEEKYTDAEFQQLRQKYDYCTPFTKESLLYREIFEKYYPGQARMIQDFWMPNKAWEGCDVDDPSARCLANYGESGQ